MELKSKNTCIVICKPIISRTKNTVYILEQLIFSQEYNRIFHLTTTRRLRGRRTFLSGIWKGSLNRGNAQFTRYLFQLSQNTTAVFPETWCSEYTILHQKLYVRANTWQKKHNQDNYVIHKSSTTYKVFMWTEFIVSGLLCKVVFNPYVTINLAINDTIASNLEETIVIDLMKKWYNFTDLFCIGLIYSYLVLLVLFSEQNIASDKCKSQKILKWKCNRQRMKGRVLKYSLLHRTMVPARSRTWTYTISCTLYTYISF